MDLTFHEKSLWLMFVAIVLIYGGYFAAVLPPGSADVHAGQVVLFVGTVVSLIVVAAAGHALIASRRKPEESDERQQLISLIGNRNASYVLGTGVFVSIITALTIDGNFWFTHVLFGFLVLAELCDIATQLFLYRRLS
jgi:hypothetical protein